MLSIHAIKTAAVARSYFEKDNYYEKGSAEGIEASEWFGKAAEILGLSGRVNADQFERILEGKIDVPIEDKIDPKNVRYEQREVGVRNKETGELEHHPGWDLTFSAPKSVSLVGLSGNDGRILKAHADAVKETLAYIEKHHILHRARTENKSIEYQNTGNLITALHHHDTSRELDPQLHTHAVLMNITQRLDGEWRSIHSKPIFELKKTLGAVYRGYLAENVKSLGYEIEATNKEGFFEIKNVPKELIQENSKRRAQIVDALNERNLSGGKAAAQASLKTRASKKDVDRDSLNQAWQASLGEHKAGIQNLIESSKLVQQSGFQQNNKSINQDHAINNANQAVGYAIASLSSREAVIKESNIIETAMQMGVGVSNIQEIRKAIQTAEKSEALLPCDIPTTLHTLAHNDRLFTTPEQLKLEQTILSKMQMGKGSTVGITSKEAATQQLNNLNAALPDNAKFTRGQLSSAHMIVTTPDRFSAVQGYAGTGKTTMARAVLHIANEKGWTVEGMAPTAAAAEALSNSLGVKARTVESALQTKFDDKTQKLWLVDESSFLSNQSMKALIQKAEREEAKVVFIGDVKQLSAIEAGKPFTQLQKHGIKVSSMDEILRQKAGTNLHNAIQYAITGKVDKSFDQLVDSIQSIQSRDKRLETLAKDYLKLKQEERDTTLVVVPSNVDREVVNEHIRNGLKEANTLTKELPTTALGRHDQTKADKAIAVTYKGATHVQFMNDIKQLELKQNQYYRIIGINAKENTVTLQDGKRTIEWNPKRVAGRRKDGRGVIAFKEKERSIAVGETIRWTYNDKPRHILNGELATVQKITKDMATVKLANGNSVQMNLSKPENKHWDHAYALTAHVAQGMTYTKVLAAMDSMHKSLSTQQSFYVIISRAKEAARILTDDVNRLKTSIKEMTGEKLSSTEQIKERQPESKSNQRQKSMHQKDMAKTKSYKPIEMTR